MKARTASCWACATGSEALGNLTDRIHAQAPGRIALSEPGGALTYARLRDLAEVLALRVLAAGVTQRDIVHTAFQRPSFRLKIACAIALARVGAVHAPLAGAAPDLAAPYQQTGARVVMGDTLPALPPGITGIGLDLDDLLAAPVPTSLPCATDPALP